MTRSPPRYLVPILVTLMGAAPLAAEPLSDIVEVDLRHGWRAPDGSHVAGLEIRLAPGWKTYWRMPGEAGIPPIFDWRGSRNLSDVSVHWPVPEVTHDNGMRSIGYAGGVLLPLTIRPGQAGEEIALRAEVSLGICEEICIPVTLSVSGDLSAGGARDGAIVAALVDAPMTAEAAGVARATCRIRPGAHGLAVTAAVDMPQMPAGEIMVIEAGDPAIWTSDTRTWREGGTLYAEAQMMHVEGAPMSVDRGAMRLTVLAGGDAVEIAGCGAG